MIFDVLRLIRNVETPVSVDDICQRLNMQRALVLRNLKQFENEGYDIAEEDGKLCMYSYPEIMTSCEILSRVNTTWAAKQVFHRDETTSTNDEAMEMAEEGREHGTLLVAEHQTGGKGRRGRSWTSPKGESIAMSLILKPDIEPSKAPMLTLVMAVAVADVLTKATDMEVKIKWPNDIVINKKKVCGILTEMSSEVEQINHVVIGVGLNVNVTSFPEEISMMATSLLNETGKRFGRADLIVAIMEFFEYYYDLFMNTGDLSAIVDVYDSYLINKDEQVRVLDPKGEYEGVAGGINDFGELIVQRKDGRYVRVSSGEVSVRGIYGYV